MAQPDIFFYEAFEEEQEALRRYLPGSIRAGFTDRTIQEYGQELPGAPVISLRTQSTIPRDWAAGLRGILTRSTGYDHVVAYRESTGIHVPAGYLPLYCNRAVAEQALMLWLALLRRLPVQTEQFRRFHRDGLTGRETAAKTLVVVGVGNIGREIVRIGQGLDMRVIGVDPVHKVEGLDYMDLAEALPQADILACSMNLTDGNRHYFDRAKLATAKPGLVFVNVARGELMRMEEFPALLDDGTIAGLGIDVYDHEAELAVSLRTGAASDDPVVRATLDLAQRPNVICTPHNAFNTREAVERKSEQSIQQFQHLQATGEFLWPVP
jgi:D-lactate dehydrogenase